MNIVFTALTLISIVMLTVASPATAFPTMLQGVMNAITLIFKLAAIYAVWLSVLKMMQATALDKKLSKLLRPLIKRLFKKESDETYGWISINLAANMLGMGGVATPAGIKAMQSMSLEGQTVASPNMILLLIINATSIQLIPATVIAIRATAGSTDASSIFLPTLISTAISTISGIILCKVFSLTDSKKDKDYYINGGLSSKNNMLNRLSFKIKPTARKRTK
ncbi:MAG: hypothetical protein HDT36_00400 [Clostridiales bacterium]|nr:hypothetical protein [Clostridiales bacterium]